MNEPNELPPPDRDRSLVEACHDLAERLRPGGPDGEIDDWSVYDEGLRRLVRWAEESGCFFENLQPLKQGGREEIVSMMVDELGFRLLPGRYSVGYADSLAFLRDDVAVFDLRPANVVRTPEGLIAPIDAIPARLDAKARAIFGVATP